MRYIPGQTLKYDLPETPIEENPNVGVTSSDSYPIPRQPVSDVALFHSWSMELDTQFETEAFKQKHGDLIRAIRKAPPMSNIDGVDQYKSELMWDDILLCLQEGNYDAAEQKSLRLYKMYADSRGINGFGSKVMVTQHNIITEERSMKKDEKRGIGQWFNKPKVEREVPDVYPMGVDR